MAGDVAPSLPLNSTMPMKRKKSLKRPFEEMAKAEMANTPIPVVIKVNSVIFLMLSVCFECKICDN